MIYCFRTKQFNSLIPTPMNRKPAIFIAAVVVLAVGGYFAFRVATSEMVRQPDSEPGEIVFGFNAALSKNSVANFGIGSRIGFEIAVNEINAGGGILGKQIRPVILDDEGDKEISKKNVEQLIFQEKAAAIIGPANSGNALYWLDIPQDNEVIVITPIATATEITTRYAQRPRNYIFRISSLEKDQARMLMAWTIQKTNNGKIAILHDTTPYGVQGEKDVTEVLSRWGKAPVLVRSFEPKASESVATDLLKEAQNAGADAVMISSLVDSSSAFAKAASKIKDFRPILLGTAANSIDLWELVGPAASNLYFSAVIIDDTDPRAIELAEKVIKLHGKVSPSPTTTANAYDAVYFLKQAFEKAGTTDKRAVRDELENTMEFQGVMRKYIRPFSKNDHEGATALDFTVGHWVDGVRVLLNDEIADIEVR